MIYGSPRSSLKRLLIKLGLKNPKIIFIWDPWANGDVGVEYED